MDFRCYSQRLLNPFRGVMNIIEFEAAEAVTLDGVHWDIYVRDAELVKDLPNSHKVQTSDIRYGRWSASSGLKRGAIYPSEDFKVLEAQGALVYEYLLKHHQQIPFPFADVSELWLLDQFAQPLVLLKSAVLEDDLELDRLPDWCACHEAGDRFTTGISQQLTNHENLSAADDMYRVLRNGSFIDARGASRCAGRHRTFPDVPGDFIGFRIVIAPQGA